MVSFLEQFKNKTEAMGKVKRKHKGKGNIVNHQQVQADYIPLSPTATTFEKAIDLWRYHFKYGWFRYLFSYVLSVIVLLPLFYGSIMPILLYSAKVSHIPLNMYSFLLLSLLIIILVGLIGALPIRFITKGYIHYRYKPLSEKEKKKIFKKHQYLIISPVIAVVSFATMYVTSFFM